MSTSWGNIITIVDEPQDMYGKVMSMKDELINEYFELCTRLSEDEISQIKKSSENPRDIKAKLAKEIVKMYHGEKNAEKAEEEFNKVFRDKELPTDVPVFNAERGSYLITDLLFDAKLVSSKNEAKRLVKGGGVEIQIQNQKSKIQNWRKEINLQDGMIIKVGSRKFVKIKLI
jgi:tyrosyl-tRNA synthetase